MWKGVVMPKDNHQSAPAIRVLVVEDFEPFRRFVCSTLGKLPHLQIVGEVSDGLKAVSHAKELQPNLILLDIGLPTLDGIEKRPDKSVYTVPHPELFLLPRNLLPILCKKLSGSVRWPTLRRCTRERS